MKAVVRFFRHRAINGYINRKRSCVLPDISQYPTVAIVIDREQFGRRKDIERTLTNMFLLKRYMFVVCVDTIPGDVWQGGHDFIIEKKDFNCCGLLKKEKKDALVRMQCDMLVDLSKMSDDVMTNNYVVSLVNSTFTVTFGNNYQSLYDMVIDSRKDDNESNQIGVLYKYLSMLIGKKDEK